MRSRKFLSVSMTTLILLSASQPVVSTLAQSIVSEPSQPSTSTTPPTAAKTSLTPVPAAPNIIDNSTFGSAKWELDARGVLTIHAGTFADTNGFSPWILAADQITKIVFDGDVVASADSSYLFHGLSRVKEIDGITKLDISKVTNFYSWLTDVTAQFTGTFGTSKWNFDRASGVLTFHGGTFADTGGKNPWKSIADQVTKVVFDGNVVAGSDSSNLFYGLSGATEIDGLSKLDTSKVTNMASMFQYDTVLTGLDLSKFNTSHVTTMNSMFANDPGLTSLNLSSFNISKVNDMEYMFYGLSALKNLDLSKWDMSKVGSWTGILTGTDALNNFSASSSFPKNEIPSAIKTVNIVKPDGSIKQSNGTVVKGTGGKTPVIDGQGNITLPSGGSVTKPGGSVLKVPAGTVIKADGSVVKPSTPPSRPTFHPEMKYLTMYRLYNKNTGEHFYTASAFERASLIKGGWNNEGIGWSAPISGTAVYRIYNPNVKGGDHYYTASQFEANNLVKGGWKWDNGGKPVFYSGGKTPVYVAFNPNATASGSHNYTSHSFEQQSLLKNGWKFGKIQFYGK